MNWLDGGMLAMLYGVPLLGGVVAAVMGAWWFTAFIVVLIAMEAVIQTVHWVNKRYDAEGF